MKYYLGVDYFFFFEDFPHMGVPGVIAANSDGTANIYINTLYCDAVQHRTIKHELRHLAKNHFYCDWMTVEEKELEADMVADESCLFADDFSSVEYIEEYGSKEPEEERLPDVLFHHPAGKIACFHSLDSLGAYAKKYIAQLHREKAAGER